MVDLVYWQHYEQSQGHEHEIIMQTESKKYETYSQTWGPDFLTQLHYLHS